MASRKRSRRPLGSARRKRRSLLPFLEYLENRLVLSPGILPLAGSSVPSPAGSDVASWLGSGNGLVPVPLASGGTAWMLAPGSTGLQAPASPGSSHGTTSPAPLNPGVILGHLPVASPFGSADVSLQTPGPSGYVPQQIQTAYGLSTGSAYNNNIAFAGIKGDGTGQTIGIFEEGYNPAFVDTSSSNYSTSALAVFDKTFGLPDPPSLTFVDHTGTPLSSTNNSSNNPDFGNYGAGVEIALDIEWAHAMAPGASIDRPLRHPCAPLLRVTSFPGMATLAGLPGVSVVSASYGYFLDLLRPGGPRANVGQHDPPAGHRRPPERELLRGVGRRRRHLTG